MTPEVYLMKCDECERYLPDCLRRGDIPTKWVQFADHSPTRDAARKYAAKRGWYIGDEELCPDCAKKRGKHGDT